MLSYEYWNHIETQDAVLPRHLSKPHHLSRDSIPLPKNYTASSQLKQNLVRGSLQVRFAELIILLRFCFFMAIGYQYVCCYEVPRLQHGELDWWRKKWCSFHRFKPQIVQHFCLCVYRLVFLLLLCLLCLFLINESFLGGLETEMQHERMESKTEHWSKISKEDRLFVLKRGMELRCSTRSVNNTMRAKSFIRRFLSMPVQTNVHIEFDEF